MLTWSLFKEMRSLYFNLKLIGKILFFPFMLLFILSCLIMVFLEFIVVDIWLLLWEILSKDGDVKWMINYMLDRD